MVGTIASRKADEAEVDNLPWDPLWDYMLNDDKLDEIDEQEEEWPRGRSIKRDDDSTIGEGKERGILDCLISGDESRCDHSSRRNSQKRKEKLRRGMSRPFWRRGRKESREADYKEMDKNVEENDADDFSSENAAKPKWMSGLQSGGAPSERKSSEVRETPPRDSDPVEPIAYKRSNSLDPAVKHTDQISGTDDSGFFPFGDFLNAWGVSSSEDSSDDLSTRVEEASYESSHISEEMTTTTDDASMVGEASSPGAAKATDEEVTEVRLTFKPLLESSSSRLASMFESSNTTPEPTLSVGEIKEEVDGLPEALGPMTEMNNPDLPVDPVIQSASSEAKLGQKKYIPPRVNQSTRNLRPGRVVCCSIKDLTQQHLQITEQTGIPFHELSKEDLAKYFPKLRTVVDNKAEVIGNCNSFEGSLPAHLQTTLLRRGKPQSLYEYEYETGQHMFVSYNSFGPDARSLIKLRKGPELEPAASGTVDVLMQVEASTISQTDCFIRNGFWWRLDSVPMPNIPGVDAVGKLCRIDSFSAKRYNIAIGDRVLTLTKWGGNSRYLYVDPSQLVKVPEMLDPAAVVCLAETYLAAFQVLHLGLVSGKRYRKNALKGKTCLILGSMDPKIGQAFSQIASFAGVKTIYASAKQKRFDQLESIGIIPLSRDSLEWIDKLEGKVDMIISFEQEVSPLYYSLLASRGEIVLVCCGEVKIDDTFNLLKPSRMICRRSKWQQESRTHVYDVYKEWDENTDKCKRDLEHLIDLLGKEVVSPNVLDRVPLGKVAKGQDMIETKRLSGFLVCEPWLIAKSRALRL